MNGKRACQWPFMLFVLFTAVVSKAVLGAEEDVLEEPSVSLEELPAEVLEGVFVHLDLCDYANYLKSGKTALLTRATSDMALLLMRRAARDSSLREGGTPWGLKRSTEIFSALQTVVRAHYAPSAADVESSLALDELAGQVETCFEACAALGGEGDWDWTCMAGLCGPHTLKPLVSAFSEPFVARNRDALLFVAASVGDLDLVETLLSHGGRESPSVQNAIRGGVTLHGSEEVLEAVLDLIPSMVDSVLDFLLTAAYFNASRLVAALLRRMERLQSPSVMRETIRKVFLCACSYGLVSTLRALVTTVPHRLPNVSQIRGELLRVVERGRLDLIQCLTWDPDRRGARMVLASEDLESLAFSAIDHGQIRILEYLLLDWEDASRLRSGINLGALLRAAIRRESHEAMSLLLGVDRSGHFLLPELACDVILNEAVHSGHTTVIQHLGNRL